MVWHSTLHMRLSRVYISNEFYVNSMSDDHEHRMHESWRGTAHRTWASYVYESHAVCCCVLQCVAVGSSVLQCVAVTWASYVYESHAVCGSVLQCIAVGCSVLPSHGLVTCMSLMQCLAVCCSVLQRVAVCCSHIGQSRA